MKKKRNLLTAGLLLFLLLSALSGCGRKREQSDTSETADEQTYIVGVVMFDQENPEMRMFRSYYSDYLESGFPVKFFFSDAVSSAEEEQAFIRAMKEQGAQGIISFYGLDIRDTIRVCEEEELYYVLGSGTLSDEEFSAVEDNPWFLGTVGPDPQEEYRAGWDMAQVFAKKGMKSYLVLTGGSSSGNYMHASRARGILEGLAEAEGLSYGEPVEDLIQSEETIAVDTGTESIRIVLVPGYMGTGGGDANLEQALSEHTFDALLCTYGANSFLDRITEQEKKQATNIRVGVVDCFSEENFQAIRGSDAFGNPGIDYVEGKYASMAGPAFAMLYNAMTGYPQANHADEKAVRLYQGFWKAEGRKEFTELYGYTQGIYENAYSCEDLMQVIHVFHEETTPEDLRALAEAYTVSDVKKRILQE